MLSVGKALLSVRLGPVFFVGFLLALGPRPVGASPSGCSVVRSQLRARGTAVQMFEITHDHRPTQREGLNLLKVSGVLNVETSLEDPWGKPYLYTARDQDFEVRTVGPDQM